MNTKTYKGEKTKELIVQTALELFAKDGFDLVSMQKIGDKVGISQAAVAQHFGSKRNLIMSVRAHVTQSNYSFVDPAIDPYSSYYEQLFQHCYKNIEWAILNPGMTQILILTYYFSFMNTDFKEYQISAVAQATKRVEKYVIGFYRESGRTPSDSILDITTEIHRWLLGYFLRDGSIAIHNTINPKKLKKSVTFFLDRLLKDF